MKKCSECRKEMRELTATTPEGINYNYFKCANCGDEIVDMQQLHKVAQKYRVLKDYHVKVSKWGLSLGIRIPKEVVQQYKLKDNKELILIPEKESIKLIPA